MKIYACALNTLPQILFLKFEPTFLGKDSILLVRGHVYGEDANTPRRWIDLYYSQSGINCLWDHQIDGQRCLQRLSPLDEHIIVDGARRIELPAFEASMSAAIFNI